jgi:hypothetical protein
VHLRTANVIESPFATVRLRQRVTKGTGSRQKGLLLAFKLLLMAQNRWRRINGAELVPLVRAGVKFIDGIQAERDAVERGAAWLLPTRVIGDPLSSFTRFARENQLDLPRPAG